MAFKPRIEITSFKQEDTATRVFFRLITTHPEVPSTGSVDFYWRYKGREEWSHATIAAPTHGTLKGNTILDYEGSALKRSEVVWLNRADLVKPRATFELMAEFTRKGAIHP